MLKKTFDFCGGVKRWLIIFGAVFAFGLLYNIIFGAVVDIQFTGGGLVKYSFTGEVNHEEAGNAITEAISKEVSTSVNYNVIVANSDSMVNYLSVSVSERGGLTPEDQTKMLSTLKEKYPDNNFAQMESNSVDPTMGTEFLLKCLVAVLLSALFIILYVALRFRKIGGVSAGMFALVALLCDVLVVYFSFVIFRLPLNDNFIAVVLTILGYSLNDTIIIYDRIRENRRILGPKTTLEVLVNTSINQTLTRTFMTALCTFVAVAVVTVMALIYNIESILSFSLPMMVGIISGFFSTVCLSGPLWVRWQNYKAKRRAAQRIAAKGK